MKKLNKNLSEQITLVTECGLSFKKHNTHTYTSNLTDTMTFEKRYGINNEIYILEVRLSIQLLESDGSGIRCQIRNVEKFREIIDFKFSELKKLKNMTAPQKVYFVEKKIKTFNY